MKFFGSFRLDTLNHCLWRAETRVPLTPKAFDLLRYLVDHPGRVVTHDEILEALWPETYVNPEVIKKYILSIRRVLGDKPEQPEFIETIPRRGYRFSAQVTDEPVVKPGHNVADDKGNVVGREAALAELEQYLSKAQQGRRQVVFVTGEAGIGKTTLVDLFHQRSASLANLRIARGQCVEGFGGKEPYYPMLEALGQLARDSEDGSVVQHLAKQAPTWLIQFPALVAAEQRESLQRETLGATRERMVREICEALDALTAEHTLVIILEDLHWVDPPTLDLISALARRREAAKLLVLSTYRPVDVSLSESGLKSLKQDLQVHGLCQELTVARLEETDIAVYLGREFQDSDFPQGLAGLICRLSGGNALFMTAITLELVEKGFIAREQGKWRLTEPVQDADPGVPKTLQQMLELQFDSLSPAEQSVLKSACVFGDHFSVWAISSTLDIGANEIEDICEGLAEREQFIRSAGIEEVGDEEFSAHYEFRHSLYRLAVYQSLSEVSRSRLHRLLGDRLKSLCTSDRSEVASEVAMHFEKGHAFEQAIEYYVTAAANAGRRFAYRESIQILQHALELLHKINSDRLIETELRVLELIGDTQYWLGEVSESVRAYERQAARAADAGLKSAELKALEHLVMPLGFTDPDRGISVAARAVRLSSELNDTVQFALARMLMAGYRCVYDTWHDQDWEDWTSADETLRRLNAHPLPPYHQSLHSYLLVLNGAYEEASKYFVVQPSSPISEDTSLMFYFFSVSTKTLALLRSARLGELLKLVTDGRELAAKNGNDPWLFVFREAWLRTLVFDFEGARRLCNTIISATTVYPTVQPRTIALVAQGYAELEQLRYDRAIECFNEVLNPEKTPKFFLRWVWWMTAELGLSEVSLRSGNLPDARFHADGFLRSSLSTADPYLKALAWELQTRLAMAEQNREGAREAIEKAVAILEDTEIPMAAWRVHSTAWDFYRPSTNKEAADWHLEQAALCVFRIADSFSPDEPLRQIFLTADPVRRIIDSAREGQQLNAHG